MAGHKRRSAPPIPDRFLDGMGIGLILTVPDSGRISYVNRSAAALLGYDAAEIAGGTHAYLDLTHPADRERSAKEYTRLLSGDIAQYNLDHRYLRKTGDAVWAHSTVTLIRDEDGTPQWGAVVLGEMSQRRVLEQQLAAATQLAGMITWSWDARSDEATTAGSAIFGVPKTPLPSFKKTLSMVHPDDQRAVETTIKRAIETGAGYTHEYRVIRGDGEIRHMRGTATCLLDDAGEVTHLVGATIDITHAKTRQAADQAPKTIRAILRHIEKHWNKPIYLDDLARKHGIGPRAIQRYFASRGMMPLTKHIKQLRLRHAHRALSDPKPGTSVTGVALYCGFQNPGHFSRDYRAEFGELPSETLRNASRRRGGD